MLEKHLRVTLDFKVKIQEISATNEIEEAQKQLQRALVADPELFRQFLEQLVVFEIEWLSERQGLISQTQQLHESFGIDDNAGNKVLEQVVAKLDAKTADYFKWAVENRDWSVVTTQFDKSIKAELAEVDIEEI